MKEIKDKEAYEDERMERIHATWGRKHQDE